MTKINDAGTLPTNEIAAALASGFAALDIADEAEALAAVETERTATKDAQQRAKADLREAEARLGREHVVDATAAADAYLAGKPPEQVATDCAIMDRIEALKEVRRGLRARRDALSAKERAAAKALESKLATAGDSALDLLEEHEAALFDELERIAAAAKVIGAATRSPRSHWIQERTKAAQNARASKGGDRVAPVIETPSWLREALAPHAQQIKAGRGSILSHVTPPPRPREREERPARDEEPYTPGIGGNVGFRVGSSGIAGVASTMLR